MTINCLSRCSSHRFDSQIFVKNGDFCLPHLHLVPPLKAGGPRWNIAITFGIKNLESCGYPTVKKLLRYLYSFRHNTQTWQTLGWTDGQSTPHDSIVLHTFIPLLQKRGLYAMSFCLSVHSFVTCNEYYCWWRALIMSAILATATCL